MVPPALSPELFDLLCEMRLQLAAQQKQHAQLRHECAAETANLWRAVLSGGAGKPFAYGPAWQVSRFGGFAPPAPAVAGLGEYYPQPGAMAAGGYGGMAAGGYFPQAGGMTAVASCGGYPSERERMLEDRLLELEAQMLARAQACQ